jgi:hypothetical protein
MLISILVAMVADGDERFAARRHAAMKPTWRASGGQQRGLEDRPTGVIKRCFPPNKQDLASLPPLNPPAR